MRLTMIMGLHLKMSGSPLVDIAERQHRRHLWRTAYAFDRMWMSRVSLPASIEEANITTKPPRLGEAPNDILL